MNKQTTILAGVFFVILAAVGLWYWFGTTKAQDAEVQAATKPVAAVNANLLSDQSMKNINDKKINGDIPVKIESNYQNSDLFN